MKNIFFFLNLIPVSPSYAPTIQNRIFPAFPQMREMGFGGEKEREVGGEPGRRDGPCGWSWRDGVFPYSTPWGRNPPEPQEIADFRGAVLIFDEHESPLFFIIS
jgi:hypothetical protein